MSAPATTLGCGAYEVIIVTRGGKGTVGPIEKWTSLEWSRVLDDTSEATIEMLASPDCCGLLAQTRRWQHELKILRDGEEVWAGPITGINLAGDTPKITANDLSVWWDHRLIHRDHSYNGVDLATIFQALSDDAMEPENSARLVLNSSKCGISGDLNVLASQYKQAGPTMRDLANAGIDWTAVGRNIIAGGYAIPTGFIGPFILEHFRNLPSANFDGVQAGRIVVTGQGGGAAGQTIVGDVSNADAIYRDGLLEEVVNVSTYEDVDTATAGAQGRLDLVKDGEAVVDGFVVSPDAPFLCSDFVAGAVCRLQLATCIPVNADFRLSSVKVTQDGNSGEEKFGVSFQPIGANSV